MKARNLRIGHMVDLEGDLYADPASDTPFYQCEYAVVYGVEQETPGCTLVHFNGVSIGFPSDHELKLSPDCASCQQNAVQFPAGFLAAQSEDRGETIEWFHICAFHADCWNDGGDWEAPVYSFTEGRT